MSESEGVVMTENGIDADMNNGTTGEKGDIFGK